jgi:hypothetical protein
MNDLEIAEYLDRRMARADRERAEAHLAGCTECRQELTQSYRLVNRMRRPRRLAIGSLVAAAAAVLLFVRPGLEPRLPPAVDSVVRNGGDSSAIVAYGPIGETSHFPIRFVWGAQPGVTTYRLTVSRADGMVTWSSSSVDTVVTLPDTIPLLTGERYLWVVDALLDDGGTRSTGLHDFRPVP